MRAVNLLTPELRTAQKGSGAPRKSAMATSGGLGAMVVLGALALVVAGVAGYILSTNVVKERKASLAEVSLQNEATISRAAALKPYADFQTLAQDRASTVQALASARFDWEQSLRDLSRALPSNVYLSSLKGSVGGGAGGGSGIRSSIGGVPALELSGCTRSQPAVASLMSRLRNVQGVTRVSLAKSEKSSVAGGPAGVAGPCGKGAPPSFEMVVFFEKATVGAALAGATGESADGAAGAAAPAADANGKPADDTTAKPAATPAATQGGKTP
ncbi:MAG TPA: PilN domain-containing protein [Solirubrobacteraceae bacterium]|nr:PilN domain-containing protein [Solirubrobacteraceae bacterium]